MERRGPVLAGATFGFIAAIPAGASVLNCFDRAKTSIPTATSYIYTARR